MYTNNLANVSPISSAKLQKVSTTPTQPLKTLFRSILHPLARRLDAVEINHPVVARVVARLIPAQCPFERNISLFGRHILHIPPLCKLNPLYNQFIGLRFRALCYLADCCGEDIGCYC